ncbi:TetR family transcriptional regulator [Amycolatopsis cynarae]|uniref:TetR family transcriptional regulator n=1 Tax=Amycolatopsis cynarae TaxID=2995223 RepID=A0ABY7B8X3_9PSEU|nr:TetR family transcriptional regulator [Amycolatopsis sp. HUAS 11-8]WAL68601.1 TetR family transcriptional regulator [Amycolatopsis sp. HUAS 11-8]
MKSTGAGQRGGEGLRERKKRAMRQQLSDTAARMFLEHGFDAVRVADVARACGVSEKTVFNYFPSKEALVLDELEVTSEALRTHLADPAVPPVEAMVKIIDDELHDLGVSLASVEDQDEALARYRRFGDLIRETPSLRAYQSDTAERFTEVAAEALASRAGLRAADPVPQVAAAALLGLWRLQFRALRTHLRPGRPIQDAIDAVAQEVRCGASLIQDGLARFPAGADPVPSVPE